jgi:hypothetical protein
MGNEGALRVQKVLQSFTTRLPFFLLWSVEVMFPAVRESLVNAGQWKENLSGSLW